MLRVHVDEAEGAELTDGLDAIVAEGARRMLAAALEAEVDAYVSSQVAELDEHGRRTVVRNGHAEPRTLVTGAGPTQQIYVRDTCNEVSTVVTNCTPSTNLVSTPDTTANATTPSNSLSENPSLSECGVTTVTTSTCQVGLLIAFATKATNLSSNIQNGVENIFVRSTCEDLATTTTACTPRTALASLPAGTLATASNGDSIVPAISGDGHTVTFISAATNLVTRDTNGFADVFLAATSF